MLAAGWAASPLLARNLMSASAMWTANAATVTPRLDTHDGRTHVTPANLGAMFHRAGEAALTGRLLQRIFCDPARFAHHGPVPGAAHLGDEGAANHGRLAASHDAAGIGLFVYGRRAFEPPVTRYPARQVREASEAVARTHGVARAVFAQQAPAAIDAGAFHNDVVAVTNERVLFHHEHAFADTQAVYADLRAAAEPLGFEPVFVAVPDARVSLADAVASYLFNSQLLSLPGRDRMTLLTPQEVAQTPTVKRYLDDLVASNGPIGHVEVMDLRQSMRNGGGPACLRLRVLLDAEDRDGLGAQVLLTPARLDALETWVTQHYRDRLAPEDLGDPALMCESFAALEALTQLLGLGAVYDFQRA